jgi:hypothetical protein
MSALETLESSIFVSGLILSTISSTNNSPSGSDCRFCDPGTDDAFFVLCATCHRSAHCCYNLQHEIVMCMRYADLIEESDSQGYEEENLQAAQNDDGHCMCADCIATRQEESPKDGLLTRIATRFFDAVVDELS